MYYPGGMNSRVSPVQSIEPHRILVHNRDSNQEPPNPQSKVVTTILPLHTVLCSSMVLIVLQIYVSSANNFILFDIESGR